jgi:hypothetical protein
MTIPNEIPAEYLEYWMDELEREIETADLSSAFEEAIGILNDGVYSNFLLKVGSEGDAWPPHSPETVQRYGPHPLLVLSGAMLAASTEKGATGHIEEIGPRSAETGIDGDQIPYTFAQNFGYSEGNIPQREFFYSVDDTDERAAETFFDWAFEIITS